MLLDEIRRLAAGYDRTALAAAIGRVGRLKATLDSEHSMTEKVARRLLAAMGYTPLLTFARGRRVVAFISADVRAGDILAGNTATPERCGELPVTARWGEQLRALRMLEGVEPGALGVSRQCVERHERAPSLTWSTVEQRAAALGWTVGLWLRKDGAT